MRAASTPSRYRPSSRRSIRSNFSSEMHSRMMVLFTCVVRRASSDSSRASSPRRNAVSTVNTLSAEATPSSLGLFRASFGILIALAYDGVDRRGQALEQDPITLQSDPALGL